MSHDQLDDPDRLRAGAAFGPDQGDPRTCRSCGAPVFWRITRKGTPAPFDPDGTSHFATCPQAATWRKR